MRHRGFFERAYSSKMTGKRLGKVFAAGGVAGLAAAIVGVTLTGPVAIVAVSAAVMSATGEDWECLTCKRRW